MQNNLFNRILLLLGFFKFKKTESKDEAFNRLKKLVLSVKNREDLINAVKLINHFIKTYKINPESAEFIYFNKIINLMRLIVRKKHKKSGDKNDEGRWKCEIELERY